jgi:hypothetical protein
MIVLGEGVLQAGVLSQGFETIPRQAQDAKMRPISSQDRLEMPQDAPAQIRLRQTQDGQRQAQDSQTTQDRPKTAQDKLEAAPDTPKTGQIMPRAGLRQAQHLPRTT